MERETKILWAVFAAVVVVAVLFGVGGKVREELAPEPRAAWVAIAAGDQAAAVVGPVELTAGEPFTLYAVLEAESWSGERVFYTEAEALRLGDEEVPTDSLRRWRSDDDVRLLWFTVEGVPPYLEVGEAADLERLRFRESFRADWPQAWAVPGSVEHSRRRLVAGEEGAIAADFGTQRFHVRIEFFHPLNPVVPKLRMRSPGAEEVDSDRLAAATVRLAGPLAVPSAVFGLPQVEIAGGEPRALVAEVSELWRRRLAFSRLIVLREMLESHGREWEELDWQAVDLEEGPEWSDDGAAAGDLLRVGERFVVLAYDEGDEGRLDDADLGFDFDKGAVARRLGEVFTGEGLVEWARLGGGAEN